MAGNESDISLIFDVYGGEDITTDGSSGKIIKDQLENIVENINKTPFEIKFKIADESLKAMKDSVQQIAGSLGDVGLFSKGFNFDINLGNNAITNNAKFGVAARAGIKELKAQATELENIFKATNKAAYGATAAIQAISSAKLLTPDRLDTLSKLGDNKISLTEQLGVYREYIDLMKKAADAQGIDISSVTSKFSAQADEIVSKTEKIQTGEQDLENGFEKLKQIFGSGLDSEKLIANLESIDENIKSIVESLNKFSEALDKFNDSKSGLSDMADSLAGGSGSKSGSKGKKSGKKSGSKSKDSVMSYEEIQSDLIKIANLRSQLESVQNAQNSGQFFEDLNQYDSELKDLEHNLQGGLIKNQQEFSRTLGDISTKLQTTKRQLSDYNAVLKESEKSFMSDSQTQTNILAVNDLISKNNIEIENAKKSGIENIDLTALNNVNSALQEMKNRLTGLSGSAMTNQEFAESFRNIGIQARIAARETKKFIEENQSNIIKSGTKEYSSALNTIQRMILQGEGILSKSASAQYSNKPGSAGAFSGIKSTVDNLKNLRQELESNTLTGNEFRNTIDNSNTSLLQNEKILKDNGDLHDTLGDKIKNSIKNFSEWFSVSRIVLAVYRAFKKMVSSVIEVDTAMTELKKVTDETDATYARFLDNASSRARKLGTTLSDVVTATADFARLGYDLGEAEQLADAAVIYKNVGDGITDINTASESIISTMKAFGIEASDAMSIVDKFNEVGNNFAISSKGVGDALVRSASAMNAAGNTLDETIALITATNTVVQNPDSVGTAMKTLSMYLRAAKTEAEDAGESTEGMADSVSELRGEILKLTGNRVDIQIDENNFKSTYQIIKELSEVWDDLSDISQANILEMIGGKRNANVVSALIKNFDIAESVLQTSLDAEGSAMAENEKYLDSIQGHISKLQAAFETLGQTLVDGDLIKGIVDFGTWLLDIGNGIAKTIEFFGGLKTIILAVSGALIVFKGNMIAASIADKFNETIKSITSSFKNLTSSIMKAGETASNISVNFNDIADATNDATNSINDAADATNDAAVATQAASSATSMVIPIIGLVVTAISLVVSGISAYNSAMKEQREHAIQRSKESVEELNNLSELYNKYISLGDAVKSDVSVQKEYNNIQDEIINNLGLEKSKIGEVTEGYVSYTNAIKNAIEKKRELEMVNIAGGLNAARQNLLDAANGIGGIFDTSTPSSITSDPMKYSWQAIAAYVIGDVVGKTKNPVINSLYDKWKNPLSSEVEGNTLALNALKNAGYHGFDFGIAGWGISSGQDLSTPEDIISAYEELEKMLSVLTQSGLENNEVFDKLFNQYNSLSPIVSEYIELQNEWNNELVRGVVDQQEELPKTESEFNAYRDSIIETVSASGKFKGSEEDIAQIVDDVLAKEPGLEKFSSLLSSVPSSGSSGAEETIAYLNKLSKGFEQLDKIYKDVIDGNGFDVGLIADNKDFKEAFGNLDYYSDFISTIVKYPGDIKKCQDAFNRLTSEYIRNSNILGILNDDNKELISNYLNLYGAINNHHINTSDDVDSLINLAKASDAAAGSISLLNKIKQRISNAEEYEQLAKETGISSYLEKAKHYREEAELLGNQVAYFEYIGGNKTAEELSKPENAAKKAFENEYKTHQHKVKMELESEIEFYDWLEKRSKEVYDNKIIEESDYWKYQEEVFEGRRGLYQDYLNDIDHEISTHKSKLEESELKKSEKDYISETNQIRSLYEAGAKSLEIEIAYLRERGLKDTDKYLQTLLEKLASYRSEILKNEKDIEENAKKAFEDLVDYRVDMLKKEVDKEKDALDKRLDALKEFYEKQKKMLQDEHDEEKYLEEQKEKRKSVTDIQGQITSLTYDDSAWAQKRRLELQQELLDAQKELADFEKDHSLDVAIEALDNAYNTQEAQIQSEMDALDKTLNDPKALYNKALYDIKSSSQEQLRYAMLTYNRKYGDGNDNTINLMIDDAYKAFNVYKSVFGKSYNGMIGYASGTSNATSGLHMIDELGSETIFESKNGAKYKLFTGAEKVLNSKASNFLYEFANSGGNLLNRIFGSVFKGGLLDKIIPPIYNNNIDMGDVIVQGAANNATVSAIRREQRNNIEFVLKEFGKLNKQ